MDDTEITNNEYRQFVDWVVDSLALRKLDLVLEESENDQSPPQPSLDWEARGDIDWEADGEEGGEGALEDLFYQGNERFAGRKEFDVNKLVFLSSSGTTGKVQHMHRSVKMSTGPVLSAANRSKSIPIRSRGFATTRTHTMSQCRATTFLAPGLRRLPCGRRKLENGKSLLLLAHQNLEYGR